MKEEQELVANKIWDSYILRGFVYFDAIYKRPMICLKKKFNTRITYFSEMR